LIIITATQVCRSNQLELQLLGEEKVINYNYYKIQKKQLQLRLRPSAEKRKDRQFYHT